jgi:hypothetical protein
VELRKFLFWIAVSVTLLLVLVIWIFPISDDFHVDNSSWNGLSYMSSITHGIPLESLSDLPKSPAGTTLILIPYLDFTKIELEELKNFITRGGTLILADDFGYGNNVLEYLGLQVRFSGSDLLDPWVYYSNHNYPVISHIVPNSLTIDIERLMLNHATGLVSVENDDILAQSSVFSFLDINNNELLDINEPRGPHAVISQHNLGNGSIVLVSDPSLFINSMQGFYDNKILVQNISMFTNSKLFISKSHLPQSNLVNNKKNMEDIRTFLLTPAGTVGLLILVLTTTQIPILLKRRDNSYGTKR